jgi:hypothetical protein
MRVPEAVDVDEHAGEIEGATREWSQAESALLIHWGEHCGLVGAMHRGQIPA